MLSLYHGPLVKIRIKSLDVEYTVSKPLLCKASTYFAAMFEGDISQSKDFGGRYERQAVSLDPIEGVVSKQSVEGLLQWLYNGKVDFDIEDYEDHVSAAIEVARLALMCNVSGLGDCMAECVQEIIKSEPQKRCSERDTHAITSQHILSASYLPQGHAVRHIIAAASVVGFLDRKIYRFVREAREIPNFGADLLEEVSKTLDTMHYNNDGKPAYNCPITGEEFTFYRRFRLIHEPLSLSIDPFFG